MPCGRVLVVDDNAELRLVLHGALHAAGYDVRTAENGRAALDLLEVFAPDVLVVDLEMPVMDGPALVRALRDRGTIPFGVVAMSAGLSERASPSPWFLKKPFDLDALLALIRHVAATRERCVA